MPVENGKKIYYETYGEKKNHSILMLHGLGADHMMWEPQIQRYPKEGYHLIVPDLRAHGRSAKVEQLTLDDWVADLQRLLDELEVPKCHLMGVSMGGVIAQAFAATLSERIEKLILTDTFGEIKSFSEKILGFAAVAGFRLFKLFGKKAFAKGMASSYGESFAGKACEYFYRMSLETDFNQIILSRKAINQIDTLKQLRELNLKSMVIVGESAGNGFVIINKIRISTGIFLNMKMLIPKIRYSSTTMKGTYSPQKAWEWRLCFSRIPNLY